MNSLVALGVNNPEINTLAAFDQSQANALNAKSTQMAQARQGLEWVGSMALGAMGGKMDGHADPKLWSEGLDMLAGQGVDKSVIESLRSRPDLASTIARASLDTMQQISVANNERDYELALKQFDLQVQNAAEARADRAAAQERPVEINGQLVDPNTREVLGDYRTPEAAKPAVPPSGYRFGADGQSLEHIPGGPADPSLKPEKAEFTVSQATAAGFADRMTQSDAILSKPAVAKVMTDIVEQRGSIPGVGNMIASPEYQQADQAQRDFINAILRRESGAVIADSEFANARRQYFPAVGDSDAVLRQKAANRKNAINGVSRSAGPAYEAPDTTNYLEDVPVVGAENNGESDSDANGVEDILKGYGV